MKDVVNYCCMKIHNYTIWSYIKKVRNCPFHINVLSYDQVKPGLKNGNYIFTDLERLQPRNISKIHKYWNFLEESGEGLRLLNHPLRSMRRYELLRALYETGSNKFNISRVSEHRKPERYPVFLRDANEHSGALSPLLHTEAELENAIMTLVEGRLSRDNVLIVEYLETAGDDGIYRKYSAFNVGGEFFPVHIQYSRKWVVKTTDIIEERTLREEQEFIDEFPQESFVSNVFKMAKIDYGRIDFSLYNGKPQVWEINTNPHLLAQSGDSPQRAGVRKIYIDRYTRAMSKIAQG